MAIVVLTAGRTGSQLIVRNLRKYFQLPGMNYESDIEAEAAVVHSHNPLLTSKSSKTTWVLSLRRDLFAELMSAAIRQHEDTMSESMPSFTITPETFTQLYKFHKLFPAIVRTLHNDVVELYYEDMLEDPKYLFSKFGIDHTTNYSLLLKSPHYYKMVVQNLYHVQDLFAKLEAVPLTDEDLQEQIRFSENLHGTPM